MVKLKAPSKLIMKVCGCMENVKKFGLSSYLGRPSEITDGFHRAGRFAQIYADNIIIWLSTILKYTQVNIRVGLRN